MLIVAVLPSILFPPKKTVGRTGGPAVGDTGTAAKQAEARTAPEPQAARPPVLPPAGAPAETVWVTSPTQRLRFRPRGAALVRAELLAYRSFAGPCWGPP